MRVFLGILIGSVLYSDHDCASCNSIDWKDGWNESQQPLKEWGNFHD